MRMGYCVLVMLGPWALGAAAGETPPSVVAWGDLLDSVKGDPATESARAEIVAQAREMAAKPIVRRVYALEDVGKHRTWLDGRSRALEDEIRETFALAMSDFAAANTVAGELPVLAAAYRLTEEEVFRGRVVAQLEEMTSWSPLQRPGWTCYAPGRRLPPDGKDGNWLATGCGVRAIGDALDIMPEGSIDPELRTRLDELLQGEVAGVVDDWETERSWFINTHNPITNQWVLPTEGLVRACLLLGAKEHPEAYELGVKNLLEALDAHGPAGEFEEGVGYASFTVTSLVHAAHAMAVAGDPRALDHPFLQRFPIWLVHHVQPNDMMINCFDAGGARGAAAGVQTLASLLAMSTGSPAARWTLAELCDGPSRDLAGLAVRGMPAVGPEAAPPLFAVNERATRVNWRDSWQVGGSGVWVRGGHPTDQHDHQDRGHVNYIANGKPILIEAGTPSYDNKLMMTHYTTGVGHNLLQLGTAFPEKPADAGQYVSLPGWQKRGTVAPITVHRLDADGGDVTVDGADGYRNVRQWLRRVTWTADNLAIQDDVALVDGKQDIVLFRWHLGTRAEAVIAGSRKKFTVEWPDATIRLTGSTALAISQVTLPDNTLEPPDDAEPSHTCIVVQSAKPVAKFSLRTEVGVR